MRTPQVENLVQRGAQVTTPSRTVSEKPQHFVDVVKDKRTKNNNLEFLIGCRDFVNPIHDPWETLDLRVTTYDPGIQQQVVTRLPDQNGRHFKQ